MLLLESFIIFFYISQTLCFCCKVFHFIIIVIIIIIVNNISFPWILLVLGVSTLHLRDFSSYHVCSAFNCFPSNRFAISRIHFEVISGLQKADLVLFLLLYVKVPWWIICYFDCVCFMCALFVICVCMLLCYWYETFGYWCSTLIKEWDSNIMLLCSENFIIK